MLDTMRAARRASDGDAWRSFASELLIAMAAHALFLGWYFREPLLKGQVDSLQQKAGESAPGALANMSEMPREVLSALAVQAAELQAGVFPAWSPYSHAGTPLIGKMQNGVFAPYHIPLYALPIRWLPLWLTLVIALKSCLAYLFTYLYARSLRLNMRTGILAGTLYVAPVLEGGLFSWFGPGAYLPLLLLLCECCFQGHRRTALFFWPWAVALPFLSGHFEGAFWIDAFAAIYLLLHMAADSATPVAERLKRSAGVAGLSLLGALIASAQLYPALEYVQRSFNRMWHGDPAFGYWKYETISKRLFAADAWPLLLGLAGLAAFFAALKKILAEPRESARSLGLAAAACGLLAFSTACLANLGLDDSLRVVNPHPDPTSAVGWLVGIYAVVFAFWTWRQEGQARGVGILGRVMAAGLLIGLKAPVVANLLANLPITWHFHNGPSHRWDYNLAVAVLAAASWERLSSLPREWSGRVRAARRALVVLGVVLLGYLGAQQLKGPLLRLVGTAAVHPMAAKQTPMGGIMGAERMLTFHSRHLVAGWTAASPPPSAARVVVIPEGGDSKTLLILAAVLALPAVFLAGPGARDALYLLVLVLFACRAWRSSRRRRASSGSPRPTSTSSNPTTPTCTDSRNCATGTTWTS